MGLFKKRVDPISDRSRTLRAEIAALESQIQQLNSKIQHGSSGQLRLRSTALPNGSSPPVPHSPTGTPVHQPIFEPVDHNRVAAPLEQAANVGREAELGLRRSHLASAWERMRNQFRGPPAANPKLVSYLAAGSIKGLRPLRYEKRVARNRFLALSILLLLALWGVYAAFVRNY